MTTTDGTLNMQSTALARHEPTSLEPTNVTELRALAKDAADSRFFGAANPAQAMMIMLAGKDLGLSYTQSLRAFHVIEGRPSLSADGMVAVCLGRPDVCEYFRTVESADTYATVETKRTGNPARQTTFRIEEAQRAGLVKPSSGWAKWPSRMCLARAKSFLAREVYPDLLMGFYEPDELRDSSSRETRVTLDGEIVESLPTPEELAKGYAQAIAAAQSNTELDEIAKAIKASKLPKELLLFLSSKSQARRKELDTLAADASFPGVEVPQ